MNDDYQKLKLFTRRAFIMGLGKLSLTALLLGKLSYLQIIKKEDYKERSENNSSKLIWIKALRGRIFDRYNRILADNLVDHKAYIDKVELAKNGNSISQTLKAFYQILNLDVGNLELSYKKIKKSPITPPIEILDKLSWEQVAQLEFNSYKIPGTFVDIEYQRHYPNPSCSNILGYVGAPSEKEDLQNSLTNITKIGKNGIEQKFDKILQGKPGVRHVEVNARGTIKKEISYTEEVPGTDLKLTIDLELQNKTAKILEGQSAAAVVMDVDSGEIIAMVSSPSFDSNTLAKGISIDDWKQLTDNKRLPLTNKAVSLTYPPGSVFKPIVALAALECGISKDEQFYCKGYFEFGNRKFGCWNKQGHGWMDMHNGIIQSCNCYFFQIALKIGITPIKKYATMLGLGEKPFTELPNIQSGIMPDQKWKLEKYNKFWTISDSLNCSIGQGYIMTSPLQLCGMIARIMSGKMVTPNIVFNKTQESPFEKLKISDINLNIIKKAIIGVVNDERGIAFRHREEGLILGGKTGTAQVITKRSFAEDLSHANTPWEFKNHGLFVGFLESTKRKICCSIVIEHLGSGAATIPYAKEILLAANMNIRV